MVTKTRPKNGGEIVKDKANFNASVKMWASFYRANIHRFATDYLGLALFPFQMVLLFMMNIIKYLKQAERYCMMVAQMT